MIPGYSMPFRKTRNSHGGGLLIYVREDIPCKRLKINNVSGDIEGIFLELNIGTTKWFFIGGGGGGGVIIPTMTVYLIF